MEGMSEANSRTPDDQTDHDHDGFDLLCGECQKPKPHPRGRDMGRLLSTRAKLLQESEQRSELER